MISHQRHESLKTEIQKIKEQLYILDETNPIEAQSIFLLSNQLEKIVIELDEAIKAKRLLNRPLQLV